MNQGKLEVIKLETAKININILGVSEVKCTGISKLNSDDHYIYYCCQGSLRRNGVAFIFQTQQSPKCITWVQPQKMMELS